MNMNIPYPSEGRERTIESTFDQLEQLAADFLTQDQIFTVWAPEAEFAEVPAWSDPDIERLSTLAIPKAGSQNLPELLLYGLGGSVSLDQSMRARIQDFTSGNSHLYLADASGTGKTRLLYETMAQHWGLYFTCCTVSGSSPYGSRDLRISFQRLSREMINGQGLCPRISLSARMSKKALTQLAHNRRIAKRVFERMILGRLLFFERFLSLVDRLHIPDAEARYKWFLMQLCSSSIFADVFDIALPSVTKLSDEDVATRLQAVSDNLKSKLEFVILDEIQFATSTYLAAFATSDHSRHASVLREVLVAFGNHLPDSRIVVSGSHLDISWATEALLASRTRIHTIRHFHSLGGMESYQQCRTYLKHFFKDLVSEDDCRLAFTWMRGRWRIISSVVTTTLLYGARNFRRVLDTVIYHSTQYERPGCSLLPWYWVFEMYVVRLEREQLEPSAANGALRKAVINFIYRLSSTTYNIGASDLVSLSVARFMDGSSSAIIGEPCILLALANWLLTSTRTSIHGLVQNKLSNMALPLSDDGFVEGLAPCLWHAIESITQLDTLLRFPGTTPAFARKSAKIVLPRLSHRRKFVTISERPKRLIAVADSPEDVFAWFRNASAPFLIPDADCAADLFFVLEFNHSQRVLVAVQAKFTHQESKRRPERSHKFVPVDINEIYKKVPDAQETFTSLLALFPALPIGTRKRARGTDTPLERPARFPVLRLLCFNDPWRADGAYDPPVASIDFAQLLAQPAPQEYAIADAVQNIMEGIN